ncbi:MAG TPA: serine hydrolase domain-containing protein, partial [Candidatus Baltobacteraceae bacterium]|nr:serine hydrolase domain-containing protein [Candidatus Baltobacteraceae bacterium]
MKRWARAVWALLAGASLVWSPAAANTPEFSPAMARSIDRLAEHSVHAGRTPGLAIGVIEDGRIVYARGFGFANLSKHIRFEPSTEFYVGSLTMQFTAAAVLMLLQDHKLKLEDKVVKYVPELTVAGDATVGELLTETSGLPDYARAPDIPSDQTRSIKL